MSEPRVLLLHANKGRWKASERPHQAEWENSCEAWIFAFNGDFLNSTTAKPSDLHGYDIIFANTDPPAIKHLDELAQSRPSSAKWVTLLEGDALDYVKPRPYIRSLLDSSDVVDCINKYSLSFFKKLTTAKVEYLGFPYPAEGIRSLSTPIAERRREIFLAPMLLGRWLEYFSVKEMGIPFYGYEKKLSKSLRVVFKNFRRFKSLDRNYFHKKVISMYNDASLKIMRQTVLPNFFRHNGGASIWLNMDQRYTWGRYVLDAAALQVPIIATRSTGHAETFFPELMLENEFEIEKAQELVIRLFRDREFYENVATIPLEKFDHLRPEVKKSELLRTLYP